MDGGQTLISGAKTNHLADVIAGQSGSSAELVMENGARTLSQNAVIGLGAGAESNRVVVSGATTVWSNAGSVTVSSNQMEGNSLSLSDHATFYASALTVENNGALNASNVLMVTDTTIRNGGSFSVAGHVTNAGDVNFAAGAFIADFSTNDIFTVDAGDFANHADFTIHTPGGVAGNSNMFSGIEVLGGSFTNTGTITWNFHADIDYTQTATWGNPYVGGMRATTDIFTPYLTSGLGSPFASGFVINGITLPPDRYLTAIFHAEYYYLAVIPEPGTYALMILGVGILLLRKRLAKCARSV